MVKISNNILVIIGLRNTEIILKPSLRVSDRLPSFLKTKKDGKFEDMFCVDDSTKNVLKT